MRRLARAPARYASPPLAFTIAAAAGRLLTFDYAAVFVASTLKFQTLHLHAIAAI